MKGVTDFKIVNLNLWPVNITEIQKNKVMTCESHRGSVNAVRNTEKLRVVNVLKFGHISQLSWESGHKGELLEKRQQALNGVICAKST